MNRAIVFDLDGTLYKTRGLDRENTMAAITALAEHRNLDEHMASLELEDARGSKEGRLSVAKAMYMLGVPDAIFMKHQLAKLNPERHIPQDRELVQLIKVLHEHFKLALYTNSRKELVPRILHAIGLAQSDFDVIVAGGDVDEPKPSVTEMTNVIHELGIAPEFCYMVGDRWSVDLAPAAKIGVKTVHVTTRESLIAWIKTIQ